VLLLFALGCATPVSDPQPEVTFDLAPSQVPQAAAPSAAASEQPEASKESERWNFAVKPFIWATALEGSVGVEPLPPVEVERPFGDIAKDLDFGLMLGFEARKGVSDWALLSELFYVKLSSEVPGVEAKIQQLMLELDVSYRPGEQRWFELLAGLRYWFMNIDVDILSLTSASRRKEWVDPIVGARGFVDLSDKWSLQLRGDVGGFSAGSDLTFSLLGAVRYAIHDQSYLALGYRHLEVDFDDGPFIYDTSLSGPILGLLWSF